MVALYIKIVIIVIAYVITLHNKACVNTMDTTCKSPATQIRGAVYFNTLIKQEVNDQVKKWIPAFQIIHELRKRNGGSIPDVLLMNTVKNKTACSDCMFSKCFIVAD